MYKYALTRVVVRCVAIWMDGRRTIGCEGGKQNAVREARRYVPNNDRSGPSEVGRQVGKAGALAVECLGRREQQGSPLPLGLPAAWVPLRRASVTGKVP